VDDEYIFNLSDARIVNFILVDIFEKTWTGN